MNIPFFDYSALYLEHKDRIDNIISGVVNRGAYILQQDLYDFEQKLAEYCYKQHAIGVANGTDAIWLSLMAAGTMKGDEVILPSHTYVATPAAVKFVGATPVLVDCGSDHLIDPKHIELAITDKTKVIMPVQLNGRTCDMDDIQIIADKYGLMIIEDSAQGLGSKYNGQMAGTFGIAGTYSFYPAKVLGCFGDGGAVVTNDDTIADKVRLLRDHGRDENGEFKTWGFNSRLDNLQAAILLEKLKTFPEDIRRRREIASMYNELLSDITELELPPAPDSSPNHYDTFQNYELRAERRDELKQFLSANGVGTLIQWSGKPIHQLKNLGFEGLKLPYTDYVFEHCLMLPMNTSLKDEEVLYITEKINDFYSFGN